MNIFQNRISNCCKYLNSVNECIFKRKFKYPFKQLRQVTVLSQNSPDNNSWNQALYQAEKIVKYPVSFFNLRWLLHDDFLTIALQLNKLTISNHPILNTAKNFFYNGSNHSHQEWGLVILLISKAASDYRLKSNTELDENDVILHKQRTVAEVTLMLHYQYVLHKGLINFQNPNKILEYDKDIVAANNTAVLAGDFLLANFTLELAKLGNPYVTEIMSIALKELMESEFIGLQDENNNPIPSQLIPTKENINDTVVFNKCENDYEGEWLSKQMFIGAGLLSRACQSAMIIAEHSKEMQEHAFQFGKHFAIAWQICVELLPFIAADYSDINNVVHPFNLTSIPVMYALKNNIDLYENILNSHKSPLNFEYRIIHSEVKKGLGLKQSRQLLMKHIQCALDELIYFEENNAQDALKNMLITLRNVYGVR